MAATGAVWSLTDPELLHNLVGNWAQEQALAARRLALVKEISVRDLARKQGATSLTAWLSATLRITGPEARRMMNLANGLGSSCTATAEALAKGVVNAAQAAVVVKAVEELKDCGSDIQRQAEAVLLDDRCATFEPRTLGRAASRILAHVAPHLAEEKLRKDLERAERVAARDRSLSWSSYDDGTGRHRLVAIFGAEDAAVVKAALSALLQPAGRDDTRTAAQRAADALADLCRFTLASKDLPRDGGDAAAVVVTMNLGDLTAKVGAGMLDTGEPIGASAVRRMACCAKIIPAVLGDRSVPIDLGRTRRLFTGAARMALVLRDKGCTFPGCDRPAKWTEAHHPIHWLDGGPTDRDNGVLLCGHHHRVIHKGEWQVRIAADRHPEFLAPVWVDPLQIWQRNTYWHHR